MNKCKNNNYFFYSPFFYEFLSFTMQAKWIILLVNGPVCRMKNREISNKD